jgi:ferredoxin, 2Fe-2S
MHAANRQARRFPLWDDSSDSRVDCQADLLEEIQPSRSMPAEITMPKLTIVAFDGTRFDLDVDQGSTVMENAVRNSVPGIEAECGGACACATCHVYIDEEWSERVGPPEAMEEDMLDFAFDVRPTSRLSCQIRMKAVLDGLTVHVPERQA